MKVWELYDDGLVCFLMLWYLLPIPAGGCVQLASLDSPF